MKECIVNAAPTVTVHSQREGNKEFYALYFPVKYELRNANIYVCTRFPNTVKQIKFQFNHY